MHLHLVLFTSLIFQSSFLQANAQPPWRSIWGMWLNLAVPRIWKVIAWSGWIKRIINWTIVCSSSWVCWLRRRGQTTSVSLLELPKRTSTSGDRKRHVCFDAAQITARKQEQFRWGKKKEKTDSWSFRHNYLLLLYTEEGNARGNSGVLLMV